MGFNGRENGYQKTGPKYIDNAVAGSLDLSDMRADGWPVDKSRKSGEGKWVQFCHRCHQSNDSSIAGNTCAKCLGELTERAQQERDLFDDPQAKTKKKESAK